MTAAARPSGYVTLSSRSQDHEVILVVEGQARGVEPTDHVEVVAAPGSGDDEIVRIAATMVARGRRVIVVTADRELRQRLTETGAEVAGPRTLPYTGRNYRRTVMSRLPTRGRRRPV